MSEPECTCTELQRMTVCHDMRNEPHLVGCPRWGTPENSPGDFIASFRYGRDIEITFTRKHMTTTREETP